MRKEDIRHYALKEVPTHGGFSHTFLLIIAFGQSYLF